MAAPRQVAQKLLSRHLAGPTNCSLSSRGQLAFSTSSGSCKQLIRLPPNAQQAAAGQRRATNNNWQQEQRRFLAAQKRRTLRVDVTELADKFSMEWPKITLFGDSITRRSFDVENGCWASELAFKVGSYFDVDARGFEGYNTKWALELAPKLFPASYLDKVALFVIFFGHNDSWNEQVPMHVPVADYEANLRALVKYLETNGLARGKLIMITPTWYHHEEFQKFCRSAGMPPVGKELEEARKYSETVLSIGRELGIDVVDFFATSLKQEPLEAMFCDGVHFSRLGGKLLAEQLMPVVERKLEAQFGKPMVDLWHAIPFDQHPEVKPAIEAFLKASKQQQDQ